jgi:hypothetical protein
MSTRFLKLSNIIINTSKIVRITKEPDVYRFRFVNSGQELSGAYFFTVGWIDSSDRYFEVYRHKEPDDFEIVKKWIETLE